MKLATIRTPSGLRAVRIDDDRAVETGDIDVRTLLENANWRDRAAAASGPSHPLGGLDYAPLIPAPEKIICVGLNYIDHITETGKAKPEYPEIFAKFPQTLIGAYDDIQLPAVSKMLDFEGELAFVIGASVRHADPAQAAHAIAGYTVMNDVSVRDYQRRTTQFLQGKMFDRCTPLGPMLVTPDEQPQDGWTIRTELDGEVMQNSTTDQLLFGPLALIQYISTIITLKPGDVIATGTPGGTGSSRRPQKWLTNGAELVTYIEGVGECRNRCRNEEPVRR